MPMMENWQKCAKPGATPSGVVANNRTLLRAHGQT
jgi:hypothetical protein